jgi:hypothetical protein
MDHMEIGWEGVVWSHLAQDRDQWQARMNMVITLLGFLKGGEFLD